ncbi:MAG: SMI1/KNR4 family protein [Cyanobacteria bacterium J06641_2]
MELSDISVIGAPLFLSSSSDVDKTQTQLGIKFPVGYREYVTELGEGTLGGNYIRIYPPMRILSGMNNIYEWRERIVEYWFWDESPDILTQTQASDCVIIGDTVNGDEIVVHPSNHERIYILPRDEEFIPFVDGGLFKALEWLCSSGVLTEPFAEREFNPFDSNEEA